MDLQQFVTGSIAAFTILELQLEAYMTFQPPKWQHAEIYDILETAIGIGSNGTFVCTEQENGSLEQICEFHSQVDAETFSTIVSWDRGLEDISMYLHG